MREVTFKLAWRFTTRLQQCFATGKPAEMDSNYLKRMRALSRQVYLAFAIALLLCLSMPGALAANDPSASMTVVTLEQYEAELDRVSSVVSKFPDDASGIIALRDAIPSGWVVTGDGERFEVSAG